MLNGILGLIVLIASVYALYHIITSQAPTTTKILWAALVLILPIIGFIAWIVAGPRSGQGAA